MKKIDIISIGEILIDFIGHETNANIANTKDYHRYLGGSPTNVAVNAARLGLKTVLVAACGNDGLGSYVLKKLNENNVDTAHINLSDQYPTSVIFVSKSTDTPDFIAYREADCQIFNWQLPDELLAQAKIFHTTCFALSKLPAKQTILNRAKAAAEMGLKLSIDLNYSSKIWTDKDEVIATITQYLAFNPLVKLSLDDCFRLFGEVKTEAQIFDYFHSLGAATICLTKGKNGVTVSDKNFGLLKQEALPITDVKDSTGAGDAFWTGFLYAYLNDKNLKDSITIAQKLACIKLKSVGRLPEGIDIKQLLLA